jgi:hypothetical protein
MKMREVIKNLLNSALPNRTDHVVSKTVLREYGPDGKVVKEQTILRDTSGAEPEMIERKLEPLEREMNEMFQEMDKMMGQLFQEGEKSSRRRF